MRRVRRPRRGRRDLRRMTSSVAARPARRRPARSDAAAAAARPAGRHRPSPPPITGCPARSCNTIAPHTEADPVAILTQLLVAFGAAVGRGAYFQVEATRHHPNEFMLLVGDSARRPGRARSWDHVRRLLDTRRPGDHRPDPDRPLQRRRADLGSPRPHRPGPRHQRPAAAGDRARVRQRPEGRRREISTLSPTLRSAWDGRPLAILTRTAPARATDAHISVIGHITQTELRRHTTTRRARQRAAEPIHPARLPPRAAAARRRRPRPAERAPA